MWLMSEPPPCHGALLWHLIACLTSELLIILASLTGAYVLVLGGGPVDLNDLARELVQRCNPTRLRQGQTPQITSSKVCGGPVSIV